VGLERTRLRRGRRTIVRGTVEPPRARRKVIVTIARRGARGGYLRVARFRADAPNGRIRVPLALSRPGLYRVGVSVPGDRLNAPSRSDYLFARVLA
jgi:hypothetical protein